MELYQVKTFVAVAREKSITRASERLHLSQPAVSAHIKAIEEDLSLVLFERQPRGMSLTADGQRLLEKAERILESHREFMDEASRMKGRLSGRLRLGTGANTSGGAVGHLLAELSEKCPEVDVELVHCRSSDMLAELRNGGLDGGFYNEAGFPADDLTTLEVGRFGIFVAAPVGTLEKAARAASSEGKGNSGTFHLKALADMPWIFPVSNTCCGTAAENVFRLNGFRPQRIISIDRESVTRSLVASGVGIGFLHADSAKEAQACGEVELICEAERSVKVLFACLAERIHNPLLAEVLRIVENAPSVKGESAACRGAKHMSAQAVGRAS